MKDKKFLPISCITKLDEKNSKKLIANQIFQKRDWFRAIRSFFLSLPSSKDKNIKNSIIVKDENSYKIKCALFPNQNKQVWFEAQNDGIYNLLEFYYCQQKTTLLFMLSKTTNIKSNWLIAKKKF